MDDKTYIQIKELLDSSVNECKNAVAAVTQTYEKCSKLADLCTKIAEDLAERGDRE